MRRFAKAMSKVGDEGQARYSQAFYAFRFKREVEYGVLLPRSEVGHRNVNFVLTFH